MIFLFDRGREEGKNRSVMLYLEAGKLIAEARVWPPPPNIVAIDPTSVEELRRLMTYSFLSMWKDHMRAKSQFMCVIASLPRSEAVGVDVL